MRPQAKRPCVGATGKPGAGQNKAAALPSSPSAFWTGMLLHNLECPTFTHRHTHTGVDEVRRMKKRRKKRKKRKSVLAAGQGVMLVN